MVWFGRPLLLRSGTLLQDYIIFPKPDSLEIGLSPNSSQNTRSYSLNQSVHYLILFRCPTLLLGRRTPPKLTSEAGLPRPDSLEIGLSPNSSQNTRSYSLNQSVHYLILFRCPTLLLGRRTPPKLTSEAGLPRPDSLRIGLSPNSSQNTGSYSLDQSVYY